MLSLKCKIYGTINGTNFFQTQETEIEFVKNQVDIVTRILFSGFANQGFILPLDTCMQVERVITRSKLSEVKYTRLTQISGNKCTLEVYAKIV